MADRAAKWAALLGNWRFRGASATYEGSEDPAAPVGLAVTNLQFREGTLSARITLPEPTDQGRIVFGLDLERTRQYSAGIGGPLFLRRVPT
jgi:hypothetical protein